MTIVVRRDKSSFARLRRLRLCLDGVAVGRIGPGRTVELTGSGVPQRLTASIDWVAGELVVTDPGLDAAVEVDLTSCRPLQGMLRTFLAPDTVLALVPAGQPVPAPPPFRPGWRRIGRLWLVVILAQAVLAAVAQVQRGSFDPAGLAVQTLAVGVGCALALVAAVLILRRSTRDG